MAIETNADVAAKVRGIAAEHRVQQAELATVVGISRMGMSRRLSAQTPFTPEELIKIARRFGVPVATFFGEAALPTAQAA